MVALAGWARYRRGYDLEGGAIRVDDPEKELLAKLATMGGNDPAPLLRHVIFAELRVIPGFADGLRAMITDIDEHGVIPTLRHALRDNTRELTVS